MVPAPRTGSRAPLGTGSLSSACTAQETGSTRAPSRSSTMSGNAWALAAGTATYSANAPPTVSPIAPQFAHRFPRPARQARQWPQNSDGSTATRVPSVSPSTPPPSATTRPANSWPGTMG